MMKTGLYGLVTVLALTLALPAASAQGAEHTNVVLIMADDMGYECVSANGQTIYNTPNLDKLAAQGVRFTNGHAQPICTPSRVKIMSGRYNSRNYTRFGHMDPGIKTFGNLFRDAGYATCIVGKWQLEGGFDGPGQFGFDAYCLWQLTRIKGNKPNRFANPGLEINGEEKDFQDGSYGPDIVSDYACDFIKRQAEADKPFLLYYPMVLPHWPFEPTPDSDDWDPDYRKGDRSEKLKRPKELTSLPHFIDMVAYTDKIVGKVLKQLENAGIRENTLVIFTGDNGTHSQLTSTFNGEPYPGGKGKTTLNGTHVPLIVDWPGEAKAGSVCGDLIDFTDMLPTMLDAAGVALPGGFDADGRSFLPQVKGQPGDPREWVYCYDDPGKKEFAMTKRHKLYKDGRFYDLAQDPWEKAAIPAKERSAEEEQAAAGLLSVINEHARE